MDETPSDPAAPSELPAATELGRVTLRVGDPDSLAAFYERALGFAGVERSDERVLLATDPSEPALLALESAPDAPPRPREAAGLFHVAYRVPDRAALAAVLRRLRDAGVALDGASDHLVSEALYLADLEGNGIEIYRDRPREAWEHDDEGNVRMDTLPLDLDALLADADGSALDGGTTVGHVHLEVTDLPASEAFYRDLGFGVRSRWRGAAFLAAGPYHHHVGLNTWRGRTEPADAGRGLASFEVLVPDAETLAAVRERVPGPVSDGEDGFSTTDPDAVDVRFTSR